MPGIDYRELRTRISMAQVLKLLGFQPLKVRGAPLRGYCPVHRVSPTACGDYRYRQKHQAPFTVDLDKQVYRCFQCGSEGNALDLWASARRLPTYAAAIDLCQALEITPPPLRTVCTGHRSQHT